MSLENGGPSPKELGLQSDPETEPIDEKDATAQMYLEDLGVSWESMQGKQILDLGAGLGDFAQVAKRHGVAVTSVEKSPENWAHAGEPPSDVPYVKASAEELPFADSCVDLIVSRSGPLTIVDNKTLFEKIYAEARRVLKPGGEIRFGPGPIHTAGVGWDRVDPDHSFDSLSESEKDRRIAEEAEKYLKELTPEISRKPGTSSDPKIPPREYYSYVKPQEA